MAGTEVGRSALERIEPQRGRLGMALRDYQLAVLNPEAEWAAKVPRALDALNGAFEEHVEFTEAPLGLFDEMLHDDTIEVSSEIDQLRRDHLAVAAAIARAGEALVHPPSEEDHLREVVASVARLVARHRRRGTQLLYDVYSVDTAAGD
jgi:hypothetical protein